MITDNNRPGQEQGHAMTTEKARTGDAVAKGLRLRESARFQRARAASSAQYDPTGARFDRREADEADRMADTILTLPAAPAIGIGVELHLLRDNAAAKPGLACTVADNPDLTIATASRDRLELAADAQCLSLAVDMAETFRARNSVEKSLAHQAAAAHQLAMRFAATANKWLDHAQAGQTFNEAHRMAMVEAQRAANASARLMLAYQDAALTQQRLRTGGRQVVTVQHVQVNSGGQAVVAGKMTTSRGRRRGRKSK
jgi:hypothetical protein